MKLSNIIHNVWKDERVRELRLRKDEVKIVVGVTIEKIMEGLLSTKRVKLHRFMTLSLKKARGRRIRNPQTKEEMFIDDYYKVSVDLSKNVKEELKKMK